MFCQKCGAENKDGAAFCNSCGASLRLDAPAPTPGPQPYICKSCGNQTQPGDVFCSKCLTGIPVELRIQKSAIAPSKHNTIIQAKIATKQEQVAGISQVGPVLLVIIGLPALLLYIIPGLVLIGIAIWWSQSRENEKKKLQNEIKELEAELE